MNSQSDGSIRYAALAWFCAAAVIAYVHRSAISVITPDLQSALGTTESTMGMIMSSYYWAYAFCQVPSGYLVQKYGVRSMLAISVGLSSLFAIAVSLTWSAESFAVVWLGAGLTVASIFPACVKGITQCFASNERAFPSGALASFMSVGSFIALNLTALLIAHAEYASWTGLDRNQLWRAIYVLYGVPGVLWAVLFFMWSRRTVLQTAELSPVSPVSPGDTSQTATNKGPTSPALTSESRTGVGSAILDHDRWLLDYRTWLILIQQFFRAGGYVFYATWFPTYLLKVHHVSIKSLGFLSSLPVLGVVIGGALGGYVCDLIEKVSGSKRLSRQGMGFASHAICGLLILAAQGVSEPLPAVTLISVGSLIFAFGSSGSYAITIDLGGLRSATLFATMNMFGNIGAALSPVIIGYLIESSGWTPVLPAFAFMYLAAALCWGLLNPEP